MHMQLRNAKEFPSVFYGLHMAPGVAEYREPGSEPYRIMIDENCLKNMDTSYAGKPVYVRHVDEVNLDNIQEEADGYVVESFFNKADGKHWAKFIIVSDKGREAIRSGWKLSNAYVPKAFTGGGRWHGVDYAKEVLRADYEHLAIVPDPRYEESIILSPEDFKKYNEEKESELKKLANAKETSMNLNFFKKTKVENATDLAATSVVLPKSKKEMTIEQIINAHDAVLNMHGYADMEHRVKVGNDEMSVGELVNAHMKMCQDMEDLKKPKENEGKEDMPDQEKKNDDAVDAELDKGKGHEEKDSMGADKAEEMKAGEGVKNKEEKEGDKQGGDDGKQKPGDAEIDMKMNKKKNANFNALKDAPLDVIREIPRLDLTEDKVARGRARYGSVN